MNLKALRLPLLLAALALSGASVASAQVTVLDTSCGHGGEQADGSYQFVATCAGRAKSPDGRFAVVQRAYKDEQPPIELQDARGRRLATLPSLSDDMPFLVSWSPDSKWFYVNHYVGSGLNDLQVFEIIGAGAVERTAVGKAAVRVATHRYPCLPPDMVHPTGARWTNDGRGIVLVTVSRPTACSETGRTTSEWQSLWMIGDVTNGKIDPASIRVQPDDKPFKAPSDGPYQKR